MSTRIHADFSHILHYNGYSGSAVIDFHDNILYGRILFIDDIITYEGLSPEQLIHEFEDAVERYIEYTK